MEITLKELTIFITLLDAELNKLINKLSIKTICNSPEQTNILINRIREMNAIREKVMTEFIER